MANGKKMRRELKGAEVKQLAEKCILELRIIADHSDFGTTWEYDAEIVNKVAEILEVPFRISDRADTRVGPNLQKVW